jgi:hypothetical protein
MIQSDSVGISFDSIFGWGKLSSRRWSPKRTGFGGVLVMVQTQKGSGKEWSMCMGRVDHSTAVVVQ